MERIKVTVDEGYARWARRYDSYANSLIALEEPFVHALLGDDLAGRRVLDVACGTGRHTAVLAARGARVTGLDPNPAMLAVARAKCPQVEFREGRADAIPFEPGAFDLVLCALLMEHLPDVRPALAEMHRVARPGGAVLVSVYHPWFLLKGIPPHFREEDGQEYEMPSYVHLPSAYYRALTDLGMRVTDFLEPVVDDALIARMPKMERHRGLPHALIFRAEKPVADR